MNRPTWDRVHQLLHDALDLDPDAREAFLADLALAEPAVAREVRSLIAAHEESADFLAEPPPFQPARSVHPGDRLGPYVVIAEIGHGGMGVVYRARRDDQTFTKDVAIKLIDPGLRSEPILRRFQHERQILAMLEHPHIARLLDGGTAPDGTPFLVMEYVEGRSLLEDCDARRLGVESRLAVFLAVCDAVQFAHQRLVVHRDLKSDNVLVAADGSPRLLDFGVARLLAAEGDAANTLTAPMHRLLTPDYASPEQIRGEPAAVASDVYSLGVVLYELLAGTRPLRFATRSPEEILRVTLHDEPKAPSAAITEASAARCGATRAALRRRLGGDLDFIVLKALEKDAGRRYGSVDQLARDLRRHLDGDAVLARGGSTAYRVSRFVRRHRTAVVSASLVTAALIAGLVGTTWQARVARREQARATRRFEDVRALAHAVMFDLHDAIAVLPGSTRARETLVRHALVYLDRLRAESAGDLGLQRELGVAYCKIGDVQGQPMFPNLGRTADALKSYDTALRLIDAVSRAQPESSAIFHDLVVASQRRSDLLNVMGRPREALDDALRIRDRIRAQLALRPDDPLFQGDLCVTYGRLINMKHAAADTMGAIEDCADYLVLAEAIHRSDPGSAESRRGVLIASTKMAELRGMLGERDSAQAHYRRAERLALEAVASQPHNTDASRDLSIVYGAHGLFLAEGGQLDSALAVYDRAMKIAEDLAARDTDNVLQQADVAAGHHEIGTMLLKGRRYAEAERRFVEAFGRSERLAAADAANADTRLLLARSARGAGDASHALSLRARGVAERSRRRAQAVDWWARSLEFYRGLARDSALTGSETGTPDDLMRQLAAVRAGK